ncbi:hypothetical protein KSX_37260 [Ktedonospora formicarum]|uniref:Uncharacterized protein n=1 Tax=Ktedonospora formicarum TaxID=2778364 RepID=A0A8J3I2L3_9CHLR|nr:hypothetical protein KSX_37260 [Ktedonospora formicarum]
MDVSIKGQTKTPLIPQGREACSFRGTTLIQIIRNIFLLGLLGYGQPLIAGYGLCKPCYHKLLKGDISCPR